MRKVKNYKKIFRFHIKEREKVSKNEKRFNVVKTKKDLQYFQRICEDTLLLSKNGQFRPKLPPPYHRLWVSVKFHVNSCFIVLSLFVRVPSALSLLYPCQSMVVMEACGHAMHHYHNINSLRCVLSQRQLCRGSLLALVSKSALNGNGFARLYIIEIPVIRLPFPSFTCTFSHC